MADPSWTLDLILYQQFLDMAYNLQFNQETAAADDETGQHSSNGECASFRTCVDALTFHLQTQQIQLLSGATMGILPKVCGFG